MILKNSIRSFVSAGLLLALTATCAAKEFSVLAIGDSQWAGISILSPGGDPVLLDLSPHRRSKTQQATGSTLVFIRQRIDPETGLPLPPPKSPAAETKPPVPVARVTLPAGMSNTVLMFMPRAKPGDDGIEFDVVPIDDSLEAFPSDTLRVLNLTPVPLQAHLGDKQIEIKPGLSPALSLLEVRKPDATVVPFALSVSQVGAKPRPLYRGAIEARPNSRTLVTVHPPGTPDSRKMRVSVVLQTVELPVSK